MSLQFHVLGKTGAICTSIFLGFFALAVHAQSTLASSTATANDILKPDTMAARVAACTNCHGSNGQAGPDGYYPRLAGKPAQYLFQQLVHFRDGSRSYEPMRHLLQGLSDEYLHELSYYFSNIDLPYPPAGRSTAPRTVMEKGRMLAQTGLPGRDLPACANCHGAQLSGLEPAIPGLLGLPHDYIVSQLGAWRTGLRRSKQPDCMGEIARELKPDEMEAVAAWLASQPVHEPYKPSAADSLQIPMACGSQLSHGKAEAE